MLMLAGPIWIAAPFVLATYLWYVQTEWLRWSLRKTLIYNAGLGFFANFSVVALDFVVGSSADQHGAGILVLAFLFNFLLVLGKNLDLVIRNRQQQGLGGPLLYVVVPMAVVVLGSLGLDQALRWRQAL
ncbi:hypothetical protein GCM10028821_38490 [Hymenobacter jeollabukensis]